MSRRKHSRYTHYWNQRLNKEELLKMDIKSQLLKLKEIRTEIIQKILLEELKEGETQ